MNPDVSIQVKQVESEYSCLKSYFGPVKLPIHHVTILERMDLPVIEKIKLSFNISLKSLA